MMPVDQNNYQVSSSRRKLEIIIMKFLLSFMFVAVTVALAIEKEVSSQHELAEGLSRSLNISFADAVECVQNSGVTRDDIMYLQVCIVMSESEITEMQSLRRASCAMVCVAQKQGTMIGRDVNLDEVFNRLERNGMPRDVSDKVRYVALFCIDQVQNEDDDCMVGYKFLKCMYERSRHVMNKH